MTMSLLSSCALQSIETHKMALQSTETHNITLRNLALFGPGLRDSLSTNPNATFVNYYCYGVNAIEFSISKKNGKTIYIG